MLICVLITSSHNKAYDEMKKIWIDNISYIKTTPYGKFFRFIFIYNDINIDGDYKVMDCYLENCFDIYLKNEETLKNMIDKSLFYIQQCSIVEDYLLKSNLSTLVNFEELYKWIETNDHYINIFAGTLVCENRISGINQLISKPILKLLRNKEFKEEFKYSHIEDMVLSEAICSLDLNISIMNIPHVGFITYPENSNNKIILMNNWNNTDESIPIFYRFKIKYDRQQDVINMRNVLDKIINKNMNLNDFNLQIQVQELTKYNSFIHK